MTKERKKLERGKGSKSEMPIVAFLGPEATFSHQAAMGFFGHSATYRAADSIDEVFSLVEEDLCHHGVVPVENSYEGSVRNTLDLFYQYDLKISAEYVSRIRHHLLSKASRIEKIERLFSHPMAIAQCRTWLNTHMPGTPLNEVASTALAAKMASSNPTASAIGCRLAGQAFSLNILEQNIEDTPDNFTRFLIIGKHISKQTGKDKTSILFLLDHKPGVLHKALGAVACRNINLTRIESRPMKTRNWEYLFFVDVEGHEQEGQVSKALKEMEEHCVFLKRLGSYPSGNESND